jgi:hypothetical protein
MKEPVSLRTLAQPGGLLRKLSRRLLKKWLGNELFRPGGTTDGSLAGSAWESGPQAVPSRRDGVIDGCYA